jgi:hypothetical protein
MRETILKCVKRQGNTDIGGHAQLERFRKQADDPTKFHEIDRELQIQGLIVVVPALKISAPVTRTENDHEHRGTPTKIRFVTRQVSLSRVF